MARSISTLVFSLASLIVFFSVLAQADTASQSEPIRGCVDTQHDYGSTGVHDDAAISGKILVAGGYGNACDPAFALIEFYDPTSTMWTPTGSMMTPRLVIGQRCWSMERFASSVAISTLPLCHRQRLDHSPITQSST